MRNLISKLVPSTLFTSSLLTCALLAGCGDSAVLPRLDPVDRITGDLAIGSLLEVNGAYGNNCLQRTGSWSVGIAGFSSLTNSALSVIKNDSACQLSISSLRIGSAMTNSLYSPSSAIALGSSFAGSGTALKDDPMNPVSLYLNSRITPDLSFAGDFTIEMVYSDDPRLATGMKSATYGVASSSVSAGAVTPPDYTLSLASLAIEADAGDVVLSVSGNAALSDVMTTGQLYAITSTNLGSSPSYMDVMTDFGAATQYTISGANPTIAASRFNLVGVDLTSGVTRNLIVQNTVSGTASYQRFLITFNKP
jgi:hypothetical protein